VIFVVLGVILGQVAVSAGFSLLAVRFYRHEKAQVAQEIADWARSVIEAPNETTPSPLAVLIDQCAIVLATRLVQSVKQTISGVESGAAKGEQLAMFEAAAAESPWIALIGNMLPKRLRNALMKNPQMIGALSKLGGGNNHSAEAMPVRRHREG
jgi:Pyruvate/2-oxoacid:ferredoxin oxidoreductase gamma subunit